MPRVTALRRWMDQGETWVVLRFKMNIRTCEGFSYNLLRGFVLMVDTDCTSMPIQ